MTSDDDYQPPVIADGGLVRSHLRALTIAVDETGRAGGAARAEVARYFALRIIARIMKQHELGVISDQLALAECRAVLAAVAGFRSAMPTAVQPGQGPRPPSARESSSPPGTVTPIRPANPKAHPPPPDHPWRRDGGRLPRPFL